MTIEMTAVTSSNIAAIGYDAEKSEMHVKFKDRTLSNGGVVPGAVHIYSGVTPEIHEGFLGAESVGSHFHTNIRGKHDSRKLGDEVKENADV